MVWTFEDTLSADGSVGSVFIFIGSACPGGILQTYIAIVGSPATLYASGHMPNVTTDTKLKPASMHSTYSQRSQQAICETRTHNFVCQDKSCNAALFFI